MQGNFKKNKHHDAELQALIPQKHFLRKVNQVVDFSFITALTENLYCPNNGRPSIAPELYFRMYLLAYFYSIKSTRRLIEEIRYNIAYRWFCGFSLQDKLPHHASLSRIKNRFKKDIFEKFFLNIVYQCKQD